MKTLDPTKEVTITIKNGCPPCGHSEERAGRKASCRVDSGESYVAAYKGTFRECRDAIVEDYPNNCADALSHCRFSWEGGKTKTIKDAVGYAVPCNDTGVWYGKFLWISEDNIDTLYEYPRGHKEENRYNDQIAKERKMFKKPLFRSSRK